MKLLIVTQIVDREDPILGFFHRWIEEFAAQCEQVVVICLKKGTCELPNNVRVLSLGKEEGVPKLTYLVRFYSYIWNERKNYDAVFVHMNPEYVVLGGVLWHALSNRIALWYTHKSVTWILRLATLLVHTVFTASKESFRIPSSRVEIVGHGIDVKQFVFRDRSVRAPLHLVSVGRISRTKRQDVAVQALVLLRQLGTDATLTLVGSPLTDVDRVYQTELSTCIDEKGLENCVIWSGGVPNSAMPEILSQADILVHTSETGSLDKVVLEAMAVGVPVVTTSSEVCQVFPEEYQSGVSCPSPDARRVAEQCVALTDGEVGMSLAQIGRKCVEEEHALPRLIERICSTMSHE